MKRAFQSVTRALCSAVVLSFALVAGGCDDNNKTNTEGGEVKFVINNIAEGINTFALGETKSYTVEAENIKSTEISYPNGWSATIVAKALAVTSPKELTADVEASGNIIVRYTGNNGAQGRVSFRVQADATVTPDPDPKPEPTPDPEGSFSISATADGSTINFRIVPDDPSAKFWIGLDAEANYAQYPTPEKYVEYDLKYWINGVENPGPDDFTGYGAEGFKERLANGPIEDKFTGAPNGSYIVYAYYVNDDLTKGFGFSKVTVVVEDASTDPEEPVLNLQYDLGDAKQFGFPGQGAVVAFIEPTNSVIDWYYGAFRAEYANNMSDDEIRAALKAGSERDKDEYHGKNFGLYIYDWNTKIVLCGFYVDSNNNEGPIERMPLTVSLTGDADWNYADYLGEWTVKGKNARGNEVSFDISIEENMYNESYKIFGFTRTGKDKTYNAPARANFANGKIEFYENSLLGIDQESGNFLGFLGYAYEISNPENVGYFNIDHQVIATGVRTNNTIALDWQQFTWNGDGTEHKLQYYTFVYGYLTENEIRNQYFYLYDQDLESYVVSDMTITKKNTIGKSHTPKAFVKRSLNKR